MKMEELGRGELGWFKARKKGSRAEAFHAFLNSYHWGAGIHAGLFILCVFMCVSTEARGFTLLPFLRSYPLWVAWGPPNRGGWQASKPQGPTCLSSHRRVKAFVAARSLFTWFREWNLSPHTCTTLYGLSSLPSSPWTHCGSNCSHSRFKNLSIMICFWEGALRGGWEHIFSFQLTCLGYLKFKK